MYEPYLFVKKYGIPFYNTRLIGRRMDKVSHIMEVEALRYEFIIASNGFTIHLPHKTDYGYNPGDIHRCIDNISTVICKDVTKKYGAKYLGPLSVT